MNKAIKTLYFARRETVQSGVMEIVSGAMGSVYQVKQFFAVQNSSIGPSRTVGGPFGVHFRGR